MDATTTAVFAKAATSTHWKRTNLGLTTTVKVDGFEWTVQAQSGCKAYIVTRERWGTATDLIIPASWSQSIEIVEAGMSALRLR